MKITMPGFAVAVFSLAILPTACAQDSMPASPELAILTSLVGEYSYDYAETGSEATSGTIVFEPFADGHYLRIEESWERTDDEGEQIGLVGIIGWDAIGGYFTWYRVFSTGAYDHARGRLEDGTIIFDMTDTRWEPFGDDAWSGPETLARTKWTDFGDDGWTFLWERSVAGGPWEQMSEGRNRRVQ